MRCRSDLLRTLSWPLWTLTLVVTPVDLAAAPGQADIDRAVALRRPVLDTAAKGNGLVKQLTASSPTNLAQVVTIGGARHAIERMIDLGNAFSLLVDTLQLEVAAQGHGDVQARAEALRVRMVNILLLRTQSLATLVTGLKTLPAATPDTAAFYDEVLARCKDLTACLTAVTGNATVPPAG